MCPCRLCIQLRQTAAPGLTALILDCSLRYIWPLPATAATVFAPLDEDVQALLTASPDALADPVRAGAMRACKHSGRSLCLRPRCTRSPVHHHMLLTPPPRPPYPQAALAEILRYHVVPGTSYKLDQLTDGLWLQTLVEGEKGKLLVHKGPNQKKPTLLTTSGQKVGAAGSRQWGNSQPRAWGRHSASPCETMRCLGAGSAWGARSRAVGGGAAHATSQASLAWLAPARSSDFLCTLLLSSVFSRRCPSTSSTWRPPAARSCSPSAACWCVLPASQWLAAALGPVPDMAASARS